MAHRSAAASLPPLVICWGCDGMGRVVNRYAHDGDCALCWGEPVTVECQDCDGRGQVRDWESLLPGA
ncbi:hypothetical protein G3I76_17995 [Streptomyces sp. SID11233]|uniref:hypothetical protein n=1 Tax=Streptomyces sp. SID11385 TaxID=2706031 RepID=UPI0013BF767E|nr:hypothetical protein [Streptomyces sp. SID11385]NEA42754.1 hypothetical protein [Streptomyces sp. SID11385]NED81974.1 hypothetical protein [Streptomyces sp. SID11233]